MSRERTRFPWLGVMLTDVLAGGAGQLPAGTMVRVVSKESGSFTIRTADGTELKGSVPASAVDEPLCATIERKLLDRTNITWGASQSSWRLRATANRDIELTGGEGDEVTVRQGGVVAIGRSEDAATYLIATDSRFGGRYREVPLDWVTEIHNLPSHEHALGLMCFEFPAYAAELAGLQQGIFVQTANRWDCFDYNTARSPLTYWARSIGADPPGETVARSQLSTIRLQRGDLVHLFEGDTPVHAAVATGDGEDVYSLWNMPGYHPVRVRLSTLFELAKETTVLTHVRAATPEWHRA